MAEFGGFFNSVNGDRKYKAEDFANYFKSFITIGVSPSPGSLKVLKKSNNQIDISEGSACINGYLYYNPGTLTKSLSVGTNRQDRVILKLDLINRTLNIYIKQGTSAKAPELQRDQSVYELSIAKLIINGSNFTISDERNDTSVCGYMSFTGKADTQEMWDKFIGDWSNLKALWQDWFTSMQGQSIRGIYIQNTTPAAKVGDIWIQVQ